MDKNKYDAHLEFMKQALELAHRGLGEVEPNPAVGCLIVRNGTIIGRGWHERFGGPHAEINALADCRKQGYTPKGAVMYVTLEPCTHTGKTPPCCKAIIEAGIQSVVIASEDPTPLAGGGIQQLTEAGIRVSAGLCREDAEMLNAPFYKHARTGLPWIILKWAQSIDGKLTWKNTQEMRWISCEKSRQDVHRIRKKVQGILTGVDTVIADNPNLTVRINGVIAERPPLRIVLDSSLRIPADCRLLTKSDASTLVVTTHQTAQSAQKRVESLKQMGIEVLTVKQHLGRCDLNDTLRKLGQRGIQQLLVEAGPHLIGQFLAQKLADEVRIYIAPLILGSEGAAELSPVLSQMLGHQPLQVIQIEQFDSDICISAKLQTGGS